MSIAKQLGKTLGGKWTYDGMATWWCDDMIRSVSRCGQLIDPEFSDETRREYWLYGDSIPRRAEQYMRKDCFYYSDSCFKPGHNHDHGR